MNIESYQENQRKNDIANMLISAEKKVVHPCNTCGSKSFAPQWVKNYFKCPICSAEA